MAGVYGVLGVWSSLPGVYKGTSVLKHLHEIFLTSFTLLTNKEAGKEKAESVRCGERQSFHRRATYLNVTHMLHAVWGPACPLRPGGLQGLSLKFFWMSRESTKKKRARKWKKLLCALQRHFFLKVFAQSGTCLSMGRKTRPWPGPGWGQVLQASSKLKKGSHRDSEF